MPYVMPVPMHISGTCKLAWYSVCSTISSVDLSNCQALLVLKLSKAAELQFDCISVTSL